MRSALKSGHQDRIPPVDVALLDKAAVRIEAWLDNDLAGLDGPGGRVGAAGTATPGVDVLVRSVSMPPARLLASSAN